MRLLLSPLLLCAAVAACASAASPRAAAPVPGAPAPFAFTTSLDADNPLVGRVWDVARRRFIARGELETTLASHRIVLLGEKHDNPDHHRLQAAMIQAMVERGRRPAVAMEMLDLDDQPKVDEVMRAHPGDVEAFFQAVAWDKKGWPAANQYAPIVRVALAEGLPVVAASIPSRTTHPLAHEGLSALDPELVARFGLAEPMPEPLASSLRAELAEAHCGMLPDAMLAPMALVQRARDAELAERAALGKAGGAVLIAGNGHVRKDRGVPGDLARLGETSVVSVAFTEVQHGEQGPSGYAAEWHAETPPFDYLWFTPRATDADPCEGMRKSK